MISSFPLFPYALSEKTANLLGEFGGAQVAVGLVVVGLLQRKRVIVENEILLYRQAKCGRISLPYASI